MFHAQIGHLGGAGPCVVEEHHHGPVSQGQSTARGQPTNELFDLVAFEEVGFGRRGAFHGDGGDALADSEHLRRAGGDVVEERVDGSKALVAGADVVVPVSLEMTKESEDPLEAQIFQGKSSDPAALVVGYETKKEPDGVAIAVHRCRPETLDGHQMVDEERVQDVAERRDRSWLCLHQCRQGEGLEASIGLLQQGRGDGEIHGGRGGIDMSRERRELMEPGGGVQPLAIPAQQAADGEGVSQAVERWRRDSVGTCSARLPARWWKTWLAVPGFTQRRPSKLNNGAAASVAPRPSGPSGPPR